MAQHRSTVHNYNKLKKDNAMKIVNTIFFLCLGSTMLATMNHQEVGKAVQFPAELTEKMQSNPIKVRYTNYRGETAIRTIVPINFYFGKTVYHPEEQWLIRLWDVDRNAERIYALKEIEWIV